MSAGGGTPTITPFLIKTLSISPTLYRRFDNPEVSGNYSAMPLDYAVKYILHEALSTGACVFCSPRYKGNPLSAWLSTSTAAKRCGTCSLNDALLVPNVCVCGEERCVHYKRIKAS
jgi:hypothetical protein